jgi:hypothetical protein
MPRRAHVRHRNHRHDEAHERALDQDLAAVAIGDASPQRREQRGDPRRHAEADAGPECEVGDAGDAQLLEVERQKRHHQREAGEADEACRRDGEQIAPPGDRRRRRWPRD